MNLYDANGNTISIDSNTTVDVVEPANGDIPRLYLTGNVANTATGTTENITVQYRSKTDSFDCYGTIKVQGSSSKAYPKKNYTLKFFKDEAHETKFRYDFRGWGKQNKFVIKANWIDITHARNVVTARLWGDMVASRSDFDSLPTELKTAPNKGAIDGFPVMVYINGLYWGRYTLNIPKDAWTFNMNDSYDIHCVICGEDYKKTCFQESPVLLNGSDWSDEIHDTCPTAIVTRWNEVHDFVINSTDAEFVANFENHMNLLSVIDYYILAYVDCGIDSLGRNMIFLTYDGNHWIASSYDLDSTWGLAWSGGLTNNPELAMQSGYQSVINYSEGNKLFVRLENLCADAIKARYAELRSGALSETNIINRFESFMESMSSDLVAEDYAETTGEGAFTEIPSKDTNNIQQLRDFIVKRLAYVDSQIEAL